MAALANRPLSSRILAAATPVCKDPAPARYRTASASPRWQRSRAGGLAKGWLPDVAGGTAATRIEPVSPAEAPDDARTSAGGRGIREVDGQSQG